MNYSPLKNPQKHRINPNLDHRQRHPNLRKLPERQRLSSRLGLLDNDHVTRCAKDREVPGNRAPGGKRHELCGRSPGLHNERLEEGDKGHVRDELADDDARCEDRGNGGDSRNTGKGLEEAGLPDGGHENEHRSKEDERAPVDRFEHRDPLSREDENGEDGGKADQRQGDDDGAGDKRPGNVRNGEADEDRKRAFDNPGERRVGSGRGFRLAGGGCGRGELLTVIEAEHQPRGGEARDGREEEPGGECDKRCGHPTVDGDEQVLGVPDRACHAAGRDRKREGKEQQLFREP